MQTIARHKIKSGFLLLANLFKWYDLHFPIDAITNLCQKPEYSPRKLRISTNYKSNNIYSNNIFEEHLSKVWFENKIYLYILTCTCAIEKDYTYDKILFGNFTTFRKLLYDEIFFRITLLQVFWRDESYSTFTRTLLLISLKVFCLSNLFTQKFRLMHHKENYICSIYSI